MVAEWWWRSRMYIFLAVVMTGDAMCMITVGAVVKAGRWRIPVAAAVDVRVAAVADIPAVAVGDIRASAAGEGGNRRNSLDKNRTD